MEPKIGYLYVNVYKHPRHGFMLYVGSCTRRDNVRGKLNHNYHGSSHLISQYKWNRFLIREIFIKNVTNSLREESELIKVVQKLYGVHPLLKQRNEWLRKYPTGLCINGHSNNLENALNKLRKFGPTQLQQEQRERARKLASGSVKAIDAARRNIRIANVYCSLEQRLTNLSHVDRNKAVQKRIQAGYQSSTSKGQKTREVLKIRPVRRIVQCNDFVGPVQTVCRLLGNENWNVYVSREFAKGRTKVEHHGFTFILRS